MKVGDKVKVIVDDCETIPKGSIKTIEKVMNKNDFRLIDSKGIELSFKRLELKPIITEQLTPKRYATDSIDVIDFCKLYDLNFNLGNVVKYTCRDKGTDIEDYKKAIDYLQREIKHLESLE